MSFEQLSFVGKDTSGEYPRVLPWAPARTGDYPTDCARGRAYFAELHDCTMTTGNPTLLSRVLSAQIKGGEWGAVEIGFAQAMAEKIIQASQV